MVLRAAVGMPIADYFADRIWRPIGAEADASWLVDRSGHELGSHGLQATLRDYAKLGMLMARGGRVGQRSVIPTDWVTEMTRPHVSAGHVGPNFGYGYQTWIFAQNDGSFAFLGVRGQAIYVHPASRLVMVQTSVRPAPTDRLRSGDAVSFWRGVHTTLG
jgi:CubicO group peptidase (beta-lactamase class C family)